MKAIAEDEVLAVVRASTGRRVMGVGSMGVLGLVLLIIAVTTPPVNVAWLAFLLIAGGVAIWLAEAMRRATALAVELTHDGLRCSDGEMIATIDQIETLDRGVFAFKPSNGFLMKLNVKGPARWRPGLWWRTGSLVGIGGVTAASQAKQMSEMIVAVMMERES